MNDIEFIKLRNRFLLAIFISLVFIIPFFFFFYNKINIKESSIIRSIKNEESFFLFLVDKKTCSYCEKKLDDISLPYKKINIETDRSYKELIDYFELSKDDFSSSTILYIEKGNLIAILDDISEENFDNFLKYYGGVK